MQMEKLASVAAWDEQLHTLFQLRNGKVRHRKFLSVNKARGHQGRFAPKAGEKYSYRRIWIYPTGLRPCWFCGPVGWIRKEPLGSVVSLAAKRLPCKTLRTLIIPVTGSGTAATGAAERRDVNSRG